MSNKKLTIYEVKFFGLVRGLVFFGRFQVRFESSEGSRYGFLKIREVRGSVFSGLFQVYFECPN